MSVPAWVLALIERAESASINGFVTINFRAGRYHDVKVEETYFPPEKVPSLAPVCPKGCGPMNPYDYDNAFLCPTCGLKRTKAQVVAQSGR